MVAFLLIPDTTCIFDRLKNCFQALVSCSPEIRLLNLPLANVIWQLYIRSSSFATSRIGVLLKRRPPFFHMATGRSSRRLLYSPEMVLISTCSLPFTASSLPANLPAPFRFPLLQKREARQLLKHIEHKKRTWFHRIAVVTASTAAIVCLVLSGIHYLEHLNEQQIIYLEASTSLANENNFFCPTAPN